MKNLLILRLFLCVVYVATSGSWNDYIDNLIAQSADSTGNVYCDKGAIIALHSGTIWTTRGQGHLSTIELSAEEGQQIAECFKYRDFSSFQLNGVTAEGITYNLTREEDSKLVIAIKKGFGALALEASKSTIVIGHTFEGGEIRNVIKAVDTIVVYLESLGM